MLGLSAKRGTYAYEVARIKAESNEWLQDQLDPTRLVNEATRGKGIAAKTVRRRRSHARPPPARSAAIRVPSARARARRDPRS